MVNFAFDGIALQRLMFLRWMGFLLMNVGEMGNFISYAFAPASVVAPLGTVRVLRFFQAYKIDNNHEIFFSSR